MPVEIKVPYLGHNVESATVSQWLKNEGDDVKEGEVILELEADKAVLEVESPATGILSGVSAEEGSTVTPDAVLAYVAAPGESVETAKTTSKPESKAAEDSSSAPLAAAKQGPERIVVIGGGPGGYTAAIKAAQRGAKVTLIEKAKLGGTCLHTGCMPTKAYLAKTRVVEQLADAADIFKKSDGVRIDLKKLMSFKDKAVGNLTNGVKSLMKSNGIEVVNGTAAFTGPKTLSISPEKGESYDLEADIFIIAAGSIPFEIPGVKIDGKLTHNTDTIWKLESVPERLLIAGSGAVGIEFACIYKALGSEVMVVEMLDVSMPGIGRDIADMLTKILKKKGIEIEISTAITKAEKNGKKVKATLKKGDSESVESYDAILVACGRRPETSALGLDKAGIKEEKGTVVVGADMKTSVDGIFAIGDVIGQPMLAHAAFHEAEVAVNNIFGTPAEADYSKIPYCVYSFPEVGSIGLTEDQAREKKIACKTAQFPFVANGKAMVCGETEGMVKIVYDETLGEILGVHIIGEHATELIANFATAINGELTVDEVASTLMAHPTLSEAMAEAAQAALGRALHLPKSR